MKPGATVPPCASITLVLGEARLAISALDPTATMRSPEIPTASAEGRAGSPVQTEPLTIAIESGWPWSRLVMVGAHAMRAVETAMASSVAAQR